MTQQECPEVGLSFYPRASKANFGLCWLGGLDFYPCASNGQLGRWWVLLPMTTLNRPWCRERNRIGHKLFRRRIAVGADGNGEPVATVYFGVTQRAPFKIPIARVT